jgi:hypothetical protein
MLESAAVNFSSEARALLSGYVREMNDRGNPDVLITNENVETLLASPIIPKTPTQKRDKLLLWVYRHTDYFGEWVELYDGHPATCYAAHEVEFDALYQVCCDNGLLEAKGRDYSSLTLTGHEHCEKLLANNPTDSKTVFVAMWFNAAVRAAYDAAIRPAIETCGYAAVRVDNIEHNNEITDEIIAGIRGSRFVVADLTGYLGGVYYEAGFARGLGREVILTCHKDWFDGDPKENRKVHFDLDHRNIIVWDDAEALKQAIINRIRATIL